MHSVHEGSWQQQYSYDRFGNRTIDQANTYGTGIPKPNFTVNTANNRLGVASGQSGTISYDNAGNLTTDTYSGAAVLRAYDAENRMTSETQANNSVAGSYSYDGNGQRVRRNINNVETWQVYGLGGELLAEYAANASALSPQKEYGYRNGQLLITATVTAGWGTPPVLHDNPLLVGQTTVQSRHITELRDAINALRTHMGLPAFSWQQPPAVGVGDLIKADPILEMRTALDQALGPPSPAYSLGLAQGQPIKAIHIQELRNRVLAAWNGGSGSTDVRWLVSDQLGTPRMIFDQSGSLTGVSRHDYLPFGEELGLIGGRTPTQGYSAADGARQKFTGKERDNETGLDWFGPGRYYARSLGRFTSVDPLGASAKRTNPQTWNRFAYVLNRPTIAIDPDGLSTILVVVNPRSSGGNGHSTTEVQDRNGGAVRVGPTHDGRFDTRSIGQNPNRMQQYGDTPFGAYTIFRDIRSDVNARGQHTGTQGGVAGQAARAGDNRFGTGIVYMAPERGEVMTAGRDTIYFHGGAHNNEGAAVQLADQQPLQSTGGCIRMENADVNTLISTINDLDDAGDPVTHVFVGDAQYLNNLAGVRDNHGNYVYQDLRISLGIDQPPQPANQQQQPQQPQHR